MYERSSLFAGITSRCRAALRRIDRSDWLAAHTHLEYSWNAAGTAQAGAAGSNFGQQQTGSTGGDQPHPNTQPTIILNHIIKT